MQPPRVRFTIRGILVAAGILIPALFAPARGSDQPLSLSVRGPEVIRLEKEPQNGRVYNLAFQPRSGPLVCAFALQRAVQIWDVSAKPRLITTLAPPVPRSASWRASESIPHAIAFSSDGARLAMGYFGVQIWDFDRRKILFAVPLLHWFPEAVRFSAMESTLIIGCSYHGFLNVAALGLPGKIDVLRRGEYERFSVMDPKNYDLDRHRQELGREKAGTVPHEERNVYCLAISPEGKRFMAGGGPVFEEIPALYSTESAVTVWDIATGRQLFDIGDKEFPILRFCLSPNGRTLYTCGEKVLGWDAEKSGPLIQRFDASGHRTLSIAVSPDGTMLAAGSSEGTVIIWHAESATRLATLAHQGGPVYVLAFSPTSRRLAAAGERGLATLWDIEPPSRKR